MQIRTLQSRMEDTEQEILTQIEKFIAKHNYSPSVRELNRLCRSVSSLSTVKRYLDRLKEKGVIDYVPKKSRTIKIVK